MFIKDQLWNPLGYDSLKGWGSYLWDEVYVLTFRPVHCTAGMGSSIKWWSSSPNNLNVMHRILFITFIFPTLYFWHLFLNSCLTPLGIPIHTTISIIFSSLCRLYIFWSMKSFPIGRNKVWRIKNILYICNEPLTFPVGGIKCIWEFKSKAVNWVHCQQIKS